jgi:F-type H+-transporting ATPase subunit gamma
VIDHLLPVAQAQIGQIAHEIAEEMTEETRKQHIEAAKHTGVGVRAADTKAIDQKAATFGASQIDYIYEQPPEELFGGLLPKYVAIQLYRAMLESEAAEHAARMTAMDSATNNASDMIDSLTLAMNRARQAKITKEIIEIVSGAAAL